MFRFVSLIVLSFALLASDAFGQCQQGNSNTSQSSIQQSQLLQQQINQLRELQGALQLSARRTQPVRETSVAQSPTVRQPAIQARRMTVEQELVSRGYSKRLNPAIGRVQWVTTADNPDKLTANELARIGARLVPSNNIPVTLAGGNRR